MKWVNHRIVSGAIVYVVTEDPLLAVCAAAGAVIPDKVEGYPLGNYQKWKKRHRGWSHVPLIYLALMALVYFIYTEPILPFDAELPAQMGLAFLAGAVLHIAEDALCGRVPLFHPKYKFGIRLFTVGSAGEYFFTAALIAVILLAKFPQISEVTEKEILPLIQQY